MDYHFNESATYATFIRPDWAPPASVFGPVWSVLYTIMAITFGYVFYQIWQGKIPKIVALPFVVNLVSNALFTPLQFGLQNNVLALVDILIVLGSILWFMKAIRPHARWVLYANIPYLAWVSFATVLQATLTIINA